MTRLTPDAVATHESAARNATARCTVLTVSDTRTKANDESGDVLQSLLTSAGHDVSRRDIIPDDPEQIGQHLDISISGNAHVICLTGGTGFSPRDRTVEVVRQRMKTEIPGFGEIFRRLSYDEIGPPAMLSGALAGISHGSRTVLFALPGSRHAVELATSKLIVPILPHLLKQMQVDLS